MKPYSLLRSELTKHDMGRAEYAQCIKRSSAYVIKRFNAHDTWDQMDMFNTFKLFGIPESRMHEFYGREQHENRAV